MAYGPVCVHKNDPVYDVETGAMVCAHNCALVHDVKACAPLYVRSNDRMVHGVAVCAPLCVHNDDQMVHDVKACDHNIRDLAHDVVACVQNGGHNSVVLHGDRMVAYGHTDLRAVSPIASPIRLEVT